MPIESETKNNQDPSDAECPANQGAEAPRRLLRLDGRCEPPFADEIPDAHAEMERRSEHANDKKRQVPRILHVFSHVGIRRPAMREPAFRVKMPADIRKRDDARVSLRSVEPIPYPGICRNV